MNNSNFFLAVIVLYKTKLVDSLTYKSLQTSLKTTNIVLDILVFDNTPLLDCNSNMEFINSDNIHYYHSKVNVGVSGAYNYALDYAISYKKQWLILLDQDSVLDPSFISSALYAIKCNHKLKLYVPTLKNDDGIIISPCRYVLGRGSSFSSITPGNHKLKNTNFLNSGLIVSVDLMSRVGGFCQDLSMYFSDFNFINRCRKYVSDYYLFNSEIRHSMSSGDYSNMNLFLPRFDMYVKGALKCYNSIGMKSMMIFWIILRSTKLFFITKSLKPLIHAINIIFSRKSYN